MTRITLTLAVPACLALAACVPADGQDLPAIERPPARFITTEQTAFVQFLPAAGIADVCGPRVLGCASVGGTQVWMPHPCLYPRDGYAVLLCHELGHNSGWTEEHEQ